MARYTLKTKDGRVREFWCADNGGYVYEVDAAHPGTTGQQVSYCLGYTGHMLWSNQYQLVEDVRAARRRELTKERSD